MDEQDAIEQRSAAPRIVVARQLDELIGLVLHELEWAGSDVSGIPCDRLRQIFRGHATPHVLRNHCVQRQDRGDERSIRAKQGECDGVFIDRFDTGNGLGRAIEVLLRSRNDHQVSGPGGAKCLRQDGVIGEEHVIGGECLTVMPGNALPQVERVHEAVVRNFVRFGKGRLDLIPTGRKNDQRIVNAAVKPERVERANTNRIEVDVGRRCE